MHHQKQITPSLLIITAVGTVLCSLIASYFVSTAAAKDSTETHRMSQYMMQNKLIVHISSGTNEPHAQMMGLQKALKAKESGSDVFLFMDVKATDLALRSTNITFADFPPSQQLIRTLVDKGVDVYVCPHCLMVNGNTMAEVQDGIKELQMDAMMKFSSGAGVTTLDY